MSHKILVIEDNPISRKMVRIALEVEGYTVVEAPDGMTALTLMIKHKPDLVLQDLRLPDVNGFDLVSQLREIPGAADIPILALTGLIAKADELRLAAAPFTDYLFKPVEPSFLVSTIRIHLVSAQAHAEKPGENRRVLAIDDEPSQLKLFATYLRHLGFDVATATDGAEGLAKAQMHRPAAILSDVLMPGMDGFELCMKLRADPTLASVPVVLLSNNYAEEADKQLAQRVGARALVERTPDFRDAIDALLQSLQTPAEAPTDDAQALQAAHQERLALQLNHQAKMSAQFARRCAAQSAQISVLARMGEEFLRGRVDTATLLSDLLARYLDAMGFSCGAIYLKDIESQLALSAQIGFPHLLAKSLPTFFGYESVLYDTMRQAEPMSVSSTQGLTDPFSALLTHLRADTVLISPLCSAREQLGVIVLISDSPRLEPEWLTFSKAITNQLGQVIALSRGMSRLQYLASYDTLTGLPNRTHLCDRLQLAIANGTHAAVYLLNLDRFQEINNTLSYRNGNLLLGQVARRLEQSSGEQVFVARLGADEFAVLLSSEALKAATVDQTARKILKSLEPTFRLEGLPIAVRASMGVALSPEHAVDADTLLSYADMARRAAKQMGNDYLVYPSHVEPYSPDHLTLLGELREAVEQDRLTLHYQPKVSFKTGQLIGVEALLRWPHPNKGWIPPDQFISLAEKAGLIHSITLWVLTSAVKQAQLWRKGGLNISVAVNVSAHDLQESAFADFVLRVCRSTGTHPHTLTLELTERALLADPAKTDSALQRLKEMGVHLSIDDFGTGYSSLSYLQKLPVNEIKIDKSFVAGLPADERSSAIVRSIIDLGRNLRLSVVAEGIEDRPTWDLLADLCCEAAQGYHICRPLPPDEFVKWVNRSASRAQPYGTQSTFNRDLFVDDER
jgi:diguanylate cyclase (GGDEF)-like protein